MHCRRAFSAVRTEVRSRRRLKRAFTDDARGREISAAVIVDRRGPPNEPEIVKRAQAPAIIQMRAALTFLLGKPRLIIMGVK